MTTAIRVEMMSAAAPLWRCLHGGALTLDGLERFDREAALPLAKYRARNLPLLQNLAEVYGACAVVARRNGHYIGHLRFYPKAVLEAAKPGVALCLQQDFPYGPADDFGSRHFRPPAELEDKRLVIHCMMIVSDGGDGGSFRRRGLGTGMVRTLAAWAAASGWEAIEATAYEDLPRFMRRRARRGNPSGSDWASASSGRSANRPWKRITTSSGPCARKPGRGGSGRSIWPTSSSCGWILKTGSNLF